MLNDAEQCDQGSAAHARRHADDCSQHPNGRCSSPRFRERARWAERMRAPSTEQSDGQRRRHARQCTGPRSGAMGAKWRTVLEPATSSSGSLRWTSLSCLQIGILQAPRPEQAPPWFMLVAMRCCSRPVAQPTRGLSRYSSRTSRSWRDWPKRVVHGPGRGA